MKNLVRFLVVLISLTIGTLAQADDFIFAGDSLYTIGSDGQVYTRNLVDHDSPGWQKSSKQIPNGVKAKSLTFAHHDADCVGGCEATNLLFAIGSDGKFYSIDLSSGDWEASHYNLPDGITPAASAR